MEDLDMSFSSTEGASAVMTNVCLIDPEHHFKEILKSLSHALDFFKVFINKEHHQGILVGNCGQCKRVRALVALDSNENTLFLATF